MACKMMHFLDVGDASHIDEGLTFIQIGLNAYIFQHVPKELLGLNPERTLGGI